MVDTVTTIKREIRERVTETLEQNKVVRVEVWNEQSGGGYDTYVRYHWEGLTMHGNKQGGSHRHQVGARETLSQARARGKRMKESFKQYKTDYHGVL